MKQLFAVLIRLEPGGNLSVAVNANAEKNCTTGTLLTQLSANAGSIIYKARSRHVPVNKM